MKAIKLIVVSAILAGTVLSCNKEENDPQEITQIEVLNKYQKSQLLDLGVNPKNATIEERKFLDGTTQKSIVAGDLVIDLGSLSKMQKLKQLTSGNKQYRTYNLINNSHRTIDILGYIGPGNALTTKMQTALQWAVNNYNRLNSTLNFRLSYGTNYNTADMVVYLVPSSSAGGSAGFPQNGRPYKWIQILSGVNSYNTNVIEHLITHEMGHCIGFRHQDWRTRQSCGENTNEGSAGVGAILIPGTPSSNGAYSVMQACFNGREDGEFSSTDEVAIETLY